MSDFSPFLAIFSRGDSFVGQAEQFEADMEPFEEQLAIGIGDVALLAQSQVPLEQDLAFAKVLDPTEFVATFPEPREHHLLCSLFSREDQETSIGWVHRLKLMPITQEQYQLACEWPNEGWPEELPKWCEEVYKVFSAKLSAIRPDIAPLVVECPQCGSDEVMIRVDRTLSYRARAGHVQLGDVIRYVPITEVEHHHEHKAWLECQNQECGATGNMEDEEWTLPGISS